MILMLMMINIHNRLLLKNHEAVNAPLRMMSGGSYNSTLSFFSIFPFFNSKLCFLMIFFIYLVVDITPIIKSSYLDLVSLAVKFSLRPPSLLYGLLFSFTLLSLWVCGSLLTNGLDTNILFPPFSLKKSGGSLWLDILRWVWGGE